MKYLWHNYPHWTIIVWSLWLALFVPLEYAGLKRWKRGIPLTWYLRRALPRWLLWCSAAWLMYHFGVIA